ncbi:MAG: DinB family protein [Actinomycetota bacterium]
MKAQEEKNVVLPEKELFVKMVVDAWETQNSRVDKLLEDLSDEQLQTETAPEKNTGVYLLGHLTAVNDALLPILGFGEKLYPQLENVFLKNPENSDLEKPSVADLKQYWNETNAKVREHIEQTTADEWFAKHTAVTDEDFAKEPHRNKLNVLLNRTIHQSNHLGQLNFLVKK